MICLLDNEISGLKIVQYFPRLWGKFWTDCSCLSCMVIFNNYVTNKYRCLYHSTHHIHRPWVILILFKRKDIFGSESRTDIVPQTGENQTNKSSVSLSALSCYIDVCVHFPPRVAGVKVF